MSDNYFFVDKEKKIIKEALLTTTAQNKGYEFANRDLTRAQLRRFFHDVKSLQSKVESRPFAEVKPLIGMLKAKAAYATRSGGQQRIPGEFKNFLEEAVTNIKDQRDFKAFCLMFEAIVGFFYEKARR